MLSDRIFHFNAVDVAAFWRVSAAAQLIMDHAPFFHPLLSSSARHP